MVYVVVFIAVSLIAAVAGASESGHHVHIFLPASAGNARVSAGGTEEISSQDAGFVSKHMHERYRTDASKTSIGQYGKFMTGRYEYVNHGSVPDAPSTPQAADTRYMTYVATDDFQNLDVNRDFAMYPKRDEGGTSLMGDNGKYAELHTADWPAHSKGTLAFHKEFDAQEITDQGVEKLSLPKLHNTGSSWAIGFYAIFVSVFSLAAMLGVRVQRWSQPPAIVAIGDGNRSDICITMPLDCQDDIVELQPQGSTFSVEETARQYSVGGSVGCASSSHSLSKGELESDKPSLSTEALESGRGIQYSADPHEEQLAKSWLWQPALRNSRSLTVCFATSPGSVSQVDGDAVENVRPVKLMSTDAKTAKLLKKVRPSRDDVDRISWGKPSKKKGVGSRGMPHRLNAEERLAYDRAKKFGYLECAGSAWRAQRRDAPLVNTWRNWCDATAMPSVAIHKSAGAMDTVVVDLSPLRRPADFRDIQADLHTIAAAARAIPMPLSDVIEADAESNAIAADADSDADSWHMRPIHQLPGYEVTWQAPTRDAAKSVAKQLAAAFGHKESSSKATAPRAKAGKGRRSGGYGIG
jgi:hypothetical protein